jgi:hypothetical protein
MNQLDAAVRTALDEWRLDGGESAWADVLVRAGRTPRPLRPGRATLVAAVLALGLLLSLPAFGVGGRLTELIMGAKRPGIGFHTNLTTASGNNVGTFSLRTSRLFVVVGPRGRRRAVPLGRPGLPPIPIARWSLELRQPATEARLERILRGSRRHVLVARLCAPCSGAMQGRIRLRRGALGALFTGRMVVTLRSSTGSAQGVLRIELPRR